MIYPQMSWRSELQKCFRGRVLARNAFSTPDLHKQDRHTGWLLGLIKHAHFGACFYLTSLYVKDESGGGVGGGGWEKQFCCLFLF